MRVELHRAADAELIEAAIWIEQNRSGYGALFLDAFESARDMLEQYPHIGPKVGRRVHGKRILGFDYDIVYQVRRDYILIVAIAHHARRPGYWRDRLG